MMGSYRPTSCPFCPPLLVRLLYLLIVGLFYFSSVSAYPQIADEPSQLTLLVETFFIKFKHPLLGEPHFDELGFELAVSILDTSGNRVDRYSIGRFPDQMEPPDQDRATVCLGVTRITHVPLYGHDNDFFLLSKPQLKRRQWNE